MDRLRIAMFSDSALPILNGVSISVDGLVGELRDRGHSVHLFAPAHPGHLDADPNTHRFPSAPTPWALQYPVPRPPYLPMLRTFRRYSFDLVHTHTPFISGMIGLRWAESHELPIVSTYHTLYDRYAHYVKLIPRRYIRFRIAKHTNFYYNAVDHVLTPSEASLKWLRRHSVHTPVTVVPTGLRRHNFVDRGEVRAALGVSPGVRLLLYVGRLAREKNLDMLLEATALAMEHDPTLRLWLVGDGPYRADCQRLVRRLGIGDRVRFVGFVDRAEVGRYYAAADLFVFASITENQGLVIQEALATGLPAIAVAGGGATASLEHEVNGLVVKNDADAFAWAILRVVRDEGLHARLSEAAARSVRELSMGAMAERVLAVYQDTIRRRKEVVAERFACF